MGTPGAKVMTLRSAAKTLLALALGLPVSQAVLIWVAGLLASMGDAAGARIVRHVCTAFQVTWAVSLVGLVLVLAMLVLSAERHSPVAKPDQDEDR
jgi:hypothetical protein